MSVLGRVSPRVPVSQNKWVSFSKCQNPPTGKLQEAPNNHWRKKTVLPSPPLFAMNQVKLGDPPHPKQQVTDQPQTISPSQCRIFQRISHLWRVQKQHSYCFLQKKTQKKTSEILKLTCPKKCSNKKSFQTKMIMILMLFDDARFTSKLDIWKKTHIKRPILSKPQASWWLASWVSRQSLKHGSTVKKHPSKSPSSHQKTNA